MKEQSSGKKNVETFPETSQKGIRLFWETFRETSLHATAWGVEIVLFPIRHIVFNIGCNAVHFVVITNDVVVETGLPCKFDVVFIGKTGDGLFELSNDNR